jgi:hypothetical protein
MEIFGCRGFVGILQLAMGPERKQNAREGELFWSPKETNVTEAANQTHDWSPTIMFRLVQAW